MFFDENKVSPGSDFAPEDFNFPVFDDIEVTLQATVGIETLIFLEEVVKGSLPFFKGSEG